MGMYTVTKKVGETPLMALERFRKRKKLSPSTPLSYAGRLDPMASGKLLILSGDDCKKQDEYRAYEKEYLVEVLLGVKTDTGDVLGLPTIDNAPHDVKVPDVKKITERFVGPYRAPYPAFSSKTVGGKPLFLYALEHRLHEIEIPKQDGEIHTIRYRGKYKKSAPALLLYIEQKIAKLPSVDDPRKEIGRDFRRGEILSAWKTLLGSSLRRFTILKLRVKTSSGVYMRTLAEDLARELGYFGMALSIDRTKIQKPS
jgi:tRNA pseudouridine55 synthase